MFLTIRLDDDSNSLVELLDLPQLLDPYEANPTELLAPSAAAKTSRGGDGHGYGLDAMG
jgi:hypothetical protein